MQELRWVQLPPDERTTFLGDGGTGVLAFSTPSEEPPAAIPVSYGYDDRNESFYFRLSFPLGSRKPSMIERPVAFVIHGQKDGRWHSVVATGTLEPTTQLPSDSSAVQGLWSARVPEIDIFERPPDEIEFRHFCLAPEQVSGRKEVESEA